MYVKYQNLTCFKWDYRPFGQMYTIVTLSTLNLTVSGILILSLKSLGQI